MQVQTSKIEAKNSKSGAVAREQHHELFHLRGIILRVL